jgi:hypothetical protein
MRHKAMFLTLGALLLVLAAVLTGLVLLVRHEPTFYRERALAPGPRRQQQSKAFLQEFGQLLIDINSKAGRPKWQEFFTEEQVNSYLQEGFLRSGVANKLLPDGISEPRVVFSEDTIRLGFRYSRGPWSTIISIAMRVWLPTPPQEVNVVALELESLHAGALPISAQSLLEQISEIARRNNIDVTWYRHNGNPVALLRFQSDQPQPTVQLQHLQVRQGSITIQGQSLDHTPRIGISHPVSAPSSAN